MLYLYMFTSTRYLSPHIQLSWVHDDNYFIELLYVLSYFILLTYRYMDMTLDKTH